MNKKNIFFLIFLFNCPIIFAQVMLPAYQGAFNNKIISSSIANNGLDFDGTDDYVTVPSGVYFNGDLTIEAWVYPKSYSNWGRIIDFGNGPGNNVVFLAFSTGTSGYPNFRVENSQFQSTVQLPLNQWSHLAATLSGTSATIYVNGDNAGSATLVAPPNVLRTNNLIGFSNWTNDDKSNVILDDLRIWNTARTQSQIKANMNIELTGNEAGLKAYYPFNQGISAGDNTSIDKVSDKTANALNSILTNFAKTGKTSNFVVGKVGTANSIKITASTSDYLSFVKTSSFNATGDFTFETWIKFNSTGTTYTTAVMDPLFGGGQSDYIGLYYGYLSTRISVNNPCVGDRSLFEANLLTLSDWHYIAMVRSNGIVNAYLDGVFSGSTDCTGVFLNSLSTILIGKNTWRAGKLDAYITNMRYVVGTAVYTSDFTPPKNSLTSIPGTQFLLLVKDSNAPYKDSSPNNLTISTSGSPTFTPNSGPF